MGGGGGGRERERREERLFASALRARGVDNNSVYLQRQMHRHCSRSGTGKSVPARAHRQTRDKHMSNLRTFHLFERRATIQSTAITHSLTMNNTSVRPSVLTFFLVRPRRLRPRCLGTGGCGESEHTHARMHTHTHARTHARTHAHSGRGFNKKTTLTG